MLNYLDFIRNCICLTCHHPPPNDPHHIPPKGSTSLGKKTRNTNTIPLCRKCHNEYHQIGRESFAKKYNANYEQIIERLNAIWKENGLK